MATTNHERVGKAPDLLRAGPGPLVEREVRNAYQAQAQGAAPAPFRSVVIDDPVQSMDPARVDGLARVLQTASKAHQVVVFTHDDRLPEAVRRLDIAATVIEVTRREGSVVETRRALDPVARFWTGPTPGPPASGLVPRPSWRGRPWSRPSTSTGGAASSRSTSCRLPLSAFIPGRRQAQGNDEFLSRPRFLAISEFGPRNFIYHEGSRYVINRVILPVSDAADPQTGRTLITSSAKVCAQCGYLHPLPAPVIPDKCQHCGSLLGSEMKQLFRLQNVTTKRRDRINSDEEERQRQGYRIESAVRFSESGGRVACQTATIEGPDGPLATLRYGHAATIWRVNYGWKRSAPGGELGFVLDVERGYWAKEKANNDEDEPEDVMSPRTQRVVPYVEDRKNCLVFELAQTGDQRLMASLQAALRHAIEVEFQLEDTELAAEPLPKGADRRYVLFYESAEGGAGVLRQLVEDQGALVRVAKRALEICHFDPESGEDKGQAPGAKEKCEAACYDCLMSYTNQPDHPLLDRKLLTGHLLAMTQAKVSLAPTELTRDQQVERLSSVAASGLEKKWLNFLMDGGYLLPTDAGVLFEKAGTRPDFLYKADQVVVCVDGSPHDFPERAERDARQTAAMEDLGYVVLRFRHDEEWEPLVTKYPSVFGSRS